nr:hypothetical protein [Tanacetum cinerariifolium]
MASTRASISKVSKRPKNQHHSTKTIVYGEDAKTASPKHQLSSSSALNAPSKTPSTKDTSSFSIDCTPKLPASSTSPPSNGYLNSPTSPPPRVHSPPPTQQNVSMDITLTLSPITHLMSNLILHHPLHLSLVIPFLKTFLRHMETHICVALTTVLLSLD